MLNFGARMFRFGLAIGRIVFNYQPTFGGYIKHISEFDSHRKWFSKRYIFHSLYFFLLSCGLGRALVMVLSYLLGAQKSYQYYEPAIYYYESSFVRGNKYLLLSCTMMLLHPFNVHYYVLLRMRKSLKHLFWDLVRTVDCLDEEERCNAVYERIIRASRKLRLSNKFLSDKNKIAFLKHFRFVQLFYSAAITVSWLLFGTMGLLQAGIVLFNIPHLFFKLNLFISIGGGGVVVANSFQDPTFIYACFGVITSIMLAPLRSHRRRMAKLLAISGSRDEKVKSQQAITYHQRLLIPTLTNLLTINSSVKNVFLVSVIVNLFLNCGLIVNTFTFGFEEPIRTFILLLISIQLVLVPGMFLFIVRHFHNVHSPSKLCQSLIWRLQCSRNGAGLHFRLKMAFFSEIIITKRPVTITFGSMKSITSQVLLEFLGVYLVTVLYLIPFAKLQASGTL